MTDQHLKTGRAGERHAIRCLRSKGHKILARNYTCPMGEIDLITRDRDTLVFVEVKSCTSAHACPEEQVNYHKKRKLTRLARAFIQHHKLEHLPCRFDVVAILFCGDARPQVQHFPDAFEPQD